MNAAAGRRATARASAPISASSFAVPKNKRLRRVVKHAKTDWKQTFARNAVGADDLIGLSRRIVGRGRGPASHSRDCSKVVIQRAGCRTLVGVNQGLQRALSQLLPAQSRTLSPIDRGSRRLRLWWPCPVFDPGPQRRAESPDCPFSAKGRG